MKKKGSKSSKVILCPLCPKHLPFKSEKTLEGHNKRHHPELLKK